MASFNRVILAGYSTRDIELRETRSSVVCDLGLAITDKRKGDNGEKIEETTFVDCTCWGRTAEIAKQYVRKGSPVLIEGRLKLEQWEKDGQKRSKLKVIVENLTLLGGGEKSADQPRTPPKQEPIEKYPINRNVPAEDDSPF